MERLGNQQVLDAGLVEWRKLAQALHARYLSPNYLASAALYWPWPRSPSPKIIAQI